MATEIKKILFTISLFFILLPSVNGDVKGLQNLPVDPQIIRNVLVADAYYRLGLCCWESSYMADLEIFPLFYRKDVLQKGIKALKMARKINPFDPRPLFYLALIYREHIKIDIDRREHWLTLCEHYQEQFKREYKKMRRFTRILKSQPTRSRAWKMRRAR